MKKLLSLCLLLLTAIAGWAQTKFTQGDFTYTVTDEDAKTVSIAKAEAATLTGALVIPTSVTEAEVTYAVTSVGASGFNGTGITSVTIPASVMTIGDEAFQNCNSMTSITIENSGTALTMAGTRWERPFANNATTIYIGRNLTLTGEENYPLLDGAASVEFGPQVTTINPYLFSENSKLENLTIGSGVTTIGESAFNGCGTYWDNETDQGVEELEVTMGSNVETIGVNAFLGCSKLQSITLPSTLTTIGNSAFKGTGLTSITIPASVTSIGDCAFQNCENMTSIRIEDSGTALTMAGTRWERPFANNATTIYIGRNLTLTETEEDKNNPLLDNVTSVEFGPQVTVIPNYLFSGVSTLSSVKVPWLTPITLNATTFHEDTYTNATLWVPGGTKAAYEAADGWKNFANKDFSSFVVSITGSAHGTLEVGEISSTNNEKATTLIDRGEDAVFTVTPATGYELTTFTVNGDDETPTEGSYTVENLLADQTVVAGFTPITYYLTLTLNDGTATNPETFTIETETFTLNNPTKTGYDFAGWKLNGVGEAMMTVTITKGSTGNLAYTATWTPIIYNIEYTMNGGTATPDNPTTYTIETPTFTLTNPTKTGYTFKGWKLNGEGDALMTVTIEQGSTGDKGYTATWQVNEYTITFDSNGGSAVDPITLDYGSTVTPPAEPTKSGYDFAGWTPELPETMPAENITVTATWTKKTYTVSITGGGVTADNMTPEYGDNVVLTIMDDPDATLTSLTVNGLEVKESIVDNQYTITSVSGNVSVVATWSSTKEFITLATSTATFSCLQDLNFTGSELRAYIAAGYSKSGNGVLLVRVYDVPANTGLVIRGEVGPTYKIPYSTSQSYFVNLLKAHLTDEDVPATSDDKNYYNYVLKCVDDVYSWHRPESGDMKLGTKKAYLQLPSSFMPAAAAARKLELVFEDDSTTDLREFILLNNGKTGGRIYNLNGQQVDNMRKGVYIVNGHKVMK